MLEIILIRPGSTEYDRQGRIQGSLDIPLSDEGRSEAARTSKELQGRELETIYASPCQAASETGEILAADLSAKLKKIDQLRNLDLGLWQGLTLEEVRLKHPRVFRQWYDDPLSVSPPNGEPASDGIRRIEPALSKLLRKHKACTIGLILPEPLAGLARAFLTHEDLTNLWKPCDNHCRWESIAAVQPASTA
jgi:probable phosphoglycerate mutase